ncbi:hypothetical protein ACH5RR_039053 [Cinchona calisaya]|uniref:Uncharacterized protein n=1 Tax=Cinchona calisaya TaxID=153742 RepID=A0ABD2Y2E7_9GENT
MDWNRSSNKNQGIEIKMLKECIRKTWLGNSTNRKWEVNEFKRRLSEAYKKEELFWSQKARIKWLNEGDKNTSYFHASARKREKRTTYLYSRERTGNGVDLRRILVRKLLSISAKSSLLLNQETLRKYSLVFHKQSQMR